MGDICVDYIETYRKFFEKFMLSVDPSDQLPVKVAGYNLVEPEIAGAVADWTLQYLEQRKCPPSLIAHLVQKVVEEVKVLVKVNPASCGYRSNIEDFLPLKLMQTCIAKVVEVCSRYKDNAELSSLPPPTPLPQVTSCAVKNSRRSMEDRHVVIHDFHAHFNITGHGPASYYGVFDGHNGPDAAIYSVSHLHQYLAESPHYPARPVQALRDACERTDDLFTKKALRESLHGGTTAVFALLRLKESKLYVAWIGDSQAVLVRRGVPLHIVRPHKPDRTDERERIEGMGGTVLYWGAWRVNGQLAVSRAIGDIEYKPYVTAEPDVEEITLDGTEDFLILACDGLWDFVSDQEATDAVYKQLRERPEDVEAVSQRLVALAKEQSSQDNISVVVVFLTEPAEVAKRHLMETQTAQTTPNPFVSRNGSELYCGGGGGGGGGQRPHQGYEHDDDEEDFGPETDVDMVDDVILSPTIAAAKALVQGGKALEDDLDIQRKQLADFDDPADIARDTPTPPAHEVESNANVENLAESGGEESEEEWNYIRGDDRKPQTDTQVEDDMSSQLNPNAAEFVPVSPTRLLLQDDAIISASPRAGYEINMDNVQVPSEYDFSAEISQRPGDLDFANGPKAVDDYFMRDNFSTLRNKAKDINVSSTSAELGEDSIRSLNSSLNSSSVVPEDTLDKLNSVQSLEEEVTTGVLEKENPWNNFNSDTFGATNIFGKSDPMTTSVMGLPGFSDTCDPYDSTIPGTPKSTIVEAPVSPTNDDVSPINQQNDFDSPTDDLPKSPKLDSSFEVPQETAQSGHDITSSSGFDSEIGADDVIPDDNEGYITELRKSPPLDLSFKPIQTFSDTNPFGALQTPSATTPMEQFDIARLSNLEANTSEIETPKKDMLLEKPVTESHDFLQNTPSSFISLRQTPEKEEPVPFDQLESPKEIPHFEHPPNANSQLLATELPKSPEPESLEGLENPLEQDSHVFETSEKVTTENLADILSDTNCVENSVADADISEHKPINENNEDLNTTIEFLHLESKILKDEVECEQLNKQEKEIKTMISEPIVETAESPITVLVAAEPDLAPCAESPLSKDDLKINHDVADKDLGNKEKEDSVEEETKEMNLEFESHIADSTKVIEEHKFVDDAFEGKLSPDDAKSVDDGFEVISKEELCVEDNVENTKKERQENSQESMLPQEELLSPSKQTNPFLMDEHPAPQNTNQTEVSQTEEEPVILDKAAKADLLNAIDDFTFSMEEDITPSHQSNLNASNEVLFSEEPKATKKVSYQTLTPADEPKLTKTEIYVTGIDEEPVTEKIVPAEIAIDEIQVGQKEPVESVEEIKFSEIKETVSAKVEPVVSQVVTETLITALEETSEMPSAPTIEVPSTAGTPPPTPAPGVEGTDETQKTDILVAAVAAAGAVAAGTAVVAATDSKKATGVASKKPLSSAAKKTTEPATKAHTATSKPAAKPGVTKSTTATKPAAPAAKAATGTAASKPLGATKPMTSTAKPASATSAAKPGTATSAPKPGSATSAAKPTSKTSAATTAAPKKPAAATGTKPAAAKPAPAAKAAPSLAPKTAVPPKQLPVSKTSGLTLKSSSKPTTPTSKPTTPTTPKSPSVKSDVVKSPVKPTVRSTLAAKPATGVTKTAAADKKPLTNGDVKPLAKKIEISDKKPSATKAPAAKPAGTKPAPTTNKPAAPAKTTSTVPAKTKPATAPPTKPASAPAPIKRPGTAPAAKMTDKTGKDAINKQSSNTKSAVNGKSVPSKTAIGAKKTDVKLNGKVPSDKAPANKPDETNKAEVKDSQIQEDNVTTTNGHISDDHEENEKTIQIELTPSVAVDAVN